MIIPNKTETEPILAAYEYCNLHGLWKAEVIKKQKNSVLNTKLEIHMHAKNQLDYTCSLSDDEITGCFEE